MSPTTIKTTVSTVSIEGAYECLYSLYQYRNGSYGRYGTPTLAYARGTNNSARHGQQKELPADEGTIPTEDE